jgi:flagellar FliJ protein
VTRRTTVADADRPLRAVERVREVRERDSLLGLQRARESSERLRRTADASLAAVGGHATFTEGTGQEYVAVRLLLGALAHQHEDDAERARTGLVVAEEAARRWQHDRARLRAVELLLERRAARRRAEQDRRDAAEADDLATQAWLRTHHQNPGNRS